MDAKNPSRRERVLPAMASLALTLALLVLSLTALWLLAGGSPPASAAPAAELHVCPSGCAYASVQAAVDAAGTGDLIKVAAGTYSGVESRPAPPGYLSGPESIEQVVYLNKTLTIRGGYTTTNWATPDPAANPTILDAQGQGRVFFVFGDVSPTIRGLRLTGGDAEGLGGHPWGGGSDTGGGVNVLTATATIRDCWIYGNSASFGGGIYLDRSDSTVQSSEVTTNTANWGGGLSLRMSGAQILDNTITGNSVVESGSGVPSAGAGIDVGSEHGLVPTVLIQGNTFSDNHADHQGGGLSFRGETDSTVNSNLISANTAITGGGVYLWENYVELTGNTISDNTASRGGGVAIEEGAAILDGNSIADNSATDDGGGVYVQFEHYQGVGPTLTGNTIEGNSAQSGGGLATRNADVLIQGNSFSGNQASGGGGMDLFGSSDTLVLDNLVNGNSANSGGGISVGMFDGTLENNRIVSNVASSDGGGLVVFGGGTWTNNVIADNEASGRGSALFMKQGELELRHTTIARNSGSDVGALYFTEESPIGMPSEAMLVNTILVDSPVGIGVSSGNTVTAEALLWHNVTVKVQAEPGASVSLHDEHTGDPAFDADGFHLMAGSAALDSGIDAGVGVDIDGEPRPMLWDYDLGADEVTGPHLSAALAVSPEFSNPGGEVAYTAVITSDGVENATGSELTLALDGNQRPLGVSGSQGSCSITDPGWGGSAVCTLGTLSPGTAVVMEVTAEVATGVTIGQEMVSTLTADANEMANTAEVTVVAHDCHVRLNESAIEYTSVQAAVDAAAPGDLVKVAGTCLGAYERAGLLQQVYLDRELTLQGGYTTGNWTAPDPQANPTILEARDQGRVIYVSQGISATVAGLHLTGGNTEPVFALHGVSWDDEIGGGVSAISATVTLRENRIQENSAWGGGGLWLWDCDVTLEDTAIAGNSAHYCGGLGLDGSRSTLSGNVISSNSASQYSGGGGCILGGQATLERNLVTDNTAALSSGGLLLWAELSMTNDVVTDNRADGGGGGGLRVIGDSSARLWHTTMARNQGASGDGILVGGTAYLTNTILADHEVGISAGDGSTLVVNGVLWHNTPTTVEADPGATVTVDNEQTGDPAFDGDGYHLTIRSAAIDAGVDAGVGVDIDGEPRPRGAAYDLGADETDPVADVMVTKRDDPDPVIVGGALTYTIEVTNGRPAGASGVFLTDTLPYNATFLSTSLGCSQAGGVVTCDLGAMAPGAAEAFTITVNPSTTGQLINLAEVTGSEPDPALANNLQAEYTDVLLELPANPWVAAVTPDSGTDATVTPITIDGDFVQEGATASMAGSPLDPVTFVSAQRLLAVVPAGLPPGTHDLTVTNPDGHSGTLLGAFTVLTVDAPSLTSVSPGQGPNDTPVTLDIRGANLAPAVTATLRLNGDDAPLVDLGFMDSTRLRAVVPVSTTPGLYDLVVTNPDSQSAELAHAFQVLEPSENDDLYALQTDLWLDPPDIQEGEAVTIGLTLRRQGGQADLHDVDVRFYLEGGMPAFTATAPVLPPRSAVPVTADWTPPAGGQYTLYALIDPADEIIEDDEDNNLISRSVTVRRPPDDTTPPTVKDFTLCTLTRYLWTNGPATCLNTVASDDPGGSGVAYLLFVEYLYLQSKDDWEAVQQSGWLPYETSHSYYRLRLAPSRGVHYIQAWAADGAGNISSTPVSLLINVETNYYGQWISRGQVDVYRQPLEAGLGLWVVFDTYDVITDPAPGSDVRLLVWAPDGTRLLSERLKGADKKVTREFVAEVDGVYQIEVRGLGRRSYYGLWIAPFHTGARMAATSSAPGEGDEEPIVPVNSVPGRFIGLPSVPALTKEVYLPLVLRNYGP